MTTWLRRQEVPAKPLTEDRRRLVRSYMDAEEEEDRRGDLRGHPRSRSRQRIEGDAQAIQEHRPQYSSGSYASCSAISRRPIASAWRRAVVTRTL